MAKPLSWPAFRMHPGEQELCRMAMAKVMEPFPMRRLSACPPFLSAQFLDRADATLSLGPMTWPHLLVRSLLLEQLYRAQQILAGHPYHRE